VELVDVAGKLGRAGGGAAGAEARNMDHLCLRIANFDAERVAAELTARGFSVGEIDTRYGASGEGLSVYLRDPDGNGLELRQ
jgi:glyoxylase I family protein